MGAWLARVKRRSGVPQYCYHTATCMHMLPMTCEPVRERWVYRSSTKYWAASTCLLGRQGYLLGPLVLVQCWQRPNICC